MSAVTDLADYLREHLDISVLAGATSITNLTKPIVYVAPGTITPRSPSVREHQPVVWLLAPEVDPVKADTTLDAHINAVLDLIDAHPSATWTQADRDVFGGPEAGFHGYRITLTWPTRKE